MTTVHLKIQAIAAELGVSEMTVHNLITGGSLPAVNIGTGKRAHWRVSRADLDRYLDEQRAATARQYGGAA